MLTRREFLHTTGAVSLAVAAVPCHASGAANADLPATSEATYRAQPASFWLRRLLQNGRDVDHVPRIETRDAVAAFGESVTPVLERALQCENQSVQFAIIDVLELMGPVGQDVLIRATRHPTPRIRARALGRLAGQFPDTPNLVAMLSAALDDSDDWVWHSALGSLWQVHGDTKPVLRKALKHTSNEVRNQAVREIMRIDPSREFSVPLLLEMLGDSDFEVRWEAAKNLFFHIPVHGAVLPALLDALRHGNLEAVAYLPHAGASGLRELLKLLESGDLSLRMAAANSLAEFVCGCDDGPNENVRQLSAQERQAVLLASRRAAQDNDLAVSGPAKRVLAALGGTR